MIFHTGMRWVKRNYRYLDRLIFIIDVFMYCNRNIRFKRTTSYRSCKQSLEHMISIPCS